MKILITGATGYIGRRLMFRLIEADDVSVRVFVRDSRKLDPEMVDRIEIYQGDTFNIPSLDDALEGVDVAYYLIHSMADHNFEELDRQSAVNFRDACIRAGVGRIIYLGGLGEKETASRHLLSRIETGEILSAFPEKVRTIWFRAGIIIGSGSASFEIISNLVIKVPVLISPGIIKNKTQPVAIHDVMRYLDRARTLDIEGNLMIDIGCEQMTFEEMLTEMARILNIHRITITIPTFSTRIFAYGIMLLTPVSRRLALNLIDSLKSETIILNECAADYFPDITPLTFELAVEDAMGAIADMQVISSWADSSAGATCEILDKTDMSFAILTDSRTYAIGELLPESVYQSILSVGGDKGWFTYNFLWEIRGLIDILAGGIGLRGKRTSRNLRIGDSLDFWKVVDLRRNKRLLLGAQMKLPGKAWLEFSIENGKLKQTAYFLPYGVWGRMYWWILKPFHYFVFTDLARKIVLRAREVEEEKKKEMPV